MPNGTYGGVRGRKTKVGRKLLRFPPTRFRQKTFDIKYSFLSNFPEQNNIWICYIIKVGRNLQCIKKEFLWKRLLT